MNTMLKEYQPVTLYQSPEFKWNAKSIVRDLTKNLQLLSHKEHAPFPKKETLFRILDHISTNNKIAAVLSSDEMDPNLKKEEELKGDCKLGAIVCIDGRVSVLHQIGPKIKSWETAGSLLDCVQDEKGRYLLDPQKSRRLIGALTSIAHGKGNRDLLEIVTAHTSITHPDHKCGRITKKVADDKLKEEIDDVALKEADMRRQAIENTYNNLLEDSDKMPLEQVAITAMIDTDTMGFILNSGSQNEFSTTTLLRGGLAEQIESALGVKVGVHGCMKDTFTKIDSFVDYSNKVVNVAEYLLKLPSNESPFYNYVETQYKKLTESQKQALRFTIARTIANQYVTGLTIEGAENPFLHHDEQYLTVSPNGKPFGRYDITQQSFGSTPGNREDALEQVKIKLSILDKNREDVNKPDIIYFSNPMKKVLWQDLSGGSSFEAVIDAGKVYIDHLVQDPEIMQRIKDGKLVFVPMITDEDSGEVLEVIDYSPYISIK